MLHADAAAPMHQAALKEDRKVRGHGVVWEDQGANGQEAWKEAAYQSIWRKPGGGNADVPTCEGLQLDVDGQPRKGRGGIQRISEH